MTGAFVRSIRSSPLILPAILASLAACDSPPVNTVAISSEAGSVPRVPRVVVDSALPMPELIARFQAESGLRPDSLTSGAHSPESLARAFVAALGGRDTSALRSLAVSRPEYGYLIFPASGMSQPPYELDPAVAWLMLGLESEKGAARALAFAEAAQLSFVGLECPEPERRITHRLWSDCMVRLRVGNGSVQRAKLFGQVVEVGGRYKFLSYSNPLPTR
jgi:hypothetical protein